MTMNLGDIALGSIVYFQWNTYAAAGESITRGTNGTISVYKDDGTTQDTGDITDTEDFDSQTGLHNVKIDTSVDTTFYTAGNTYSVVCLGAVVDSKTVNPVLARFRLKAPDPSPVQNAQLILGGTSQRLFILVEDARGGPLTGLTYNASGLTAYYTREGAAPVQITLATQTANGAYSSGGLVLTSDANAPGQIRLDVPDAFAASGAARGQIVLKGAAFMRQATVNVEFVLNVEGADGGIKVSGHTTAALAEIEQEATDAIDAANLAEASQVSLISGKLPDELGADGSIKATLMGVNEQAWSSGTKPYNVAT